MFNKINAIPHPCELLADEIVAEKVFVRSADDRKSPLCTALGLLWDGGKGDDGSPRERFVRGAWWANQHFDVNQEYPAGVDARLARDDVLATMVLDKLKTHPVVDATCKLLDARLKAMQKLADDNKDEYYISEDVEVDGYDFGRDFTDALRHACVMAYEVTVETLLAWPNALTMLRLTWDVEVRRLLVCSAVTGSSNKADMGTMSGRWMMSRRARIVTKLLASLPDAETLPELQQPYCDGHWTVVHDACNVGNVEALRVFLRHGSERPSFRAAVLLAAPRDKRMPLHEAVGCISSWSRRADAVHLVTALLYAGAFPSPGVMFMGDTPLDIAKQCSSVEAAAVVAVLENAGAVSKRDKPEWLAARDALKSLGLWP